MENINIADELEKEDYGLEEEVRAIVNLPLLQREAERNRIAKQYKIRKTAIDKYVREHVKKEEAGGAEVVTEVEPFEYEVDGAMLLNSISQDILKHVILPDGAAEPIAAWCLLTYCYDAFRVLPILGIISPIKRCGKTTLLEALQGIANKSLIASNISPPAVFRTIDTHRPTLLIDEADTFLKDNDELRGVLNSGHTRKSSYVIRLVGDNHDTKKFSTWGPKAVSMIGNLPDTLQDRSIVIKLKRKAPGETTAKLDVDFEDDCLELRRKCRRWANDNLITLSITRPDMPRLKNDRMMDNWMPLFAIADVAGDDWLERIKSSLFKMMDIPEDEIGLVLLEDIRHIFESTGADRIFSDDLVEKLKELSERPWVDWNRGKGLTQNGLARLLRPFSVKSKTLRINENLRKGYELDSFKDSFKRYISNNLSDIAVSSVTTLQDNNIKRLDDNKSVTANNDVTDEKQDNLLKSNDCYDVTDENPISGGKEENRDMTKCYDCPACDKSTGICYAISYFKGKPDSGTRCMDAIKTCER